MLYNIPILKLLFSKIGDNSHIKLFLSSLITNSLIKKPFAYPFDINGYKLS